MALTFSRTPKEPPVPDPYGMRPPERVSDIPIPALGDDPEHQRLSAQINALDRGIEERRQTLTRYAIRAELAANSSTAGGTRKELLRGTLSRLDSQIPRSIPEPDANTEGLDPTVATGLRLAAGEEVTPPPDRDAHISRLRAEIQVIDAAVRIVRVQREELREARSTAVAEMCLPQQRKILRAKLDAALALAAAVAAERALIAEILLSGHAHCPGVLMSPPLDPASRLGAVDEWDSPVATYKRVLAEMGIVP